MNKFFRFLFFSFSFLSCSTNKPVVKQSDPYQQLIFDKQGHRGCRGLMPENTIPAMIQAIDLGVNTIEMDVVISKDKKVIVSHEAYFNYEISTKPDGNPVEVKDQMGYNIFLMDYEEVKQFDVGIKAHPRFPQQKKLKVYKPLLSELIDSVEEYVTAKKISRLFYNIEIKSLPSGDNRFHPEPAEFTELVMDIIRSKGIEKRTTVQSFDFRPLQYLHKQHPSVRTALLIEDFDKRSFEEHLKILGFSPSIYSPHFSLVTHDLVNKCHQHGMKIIPWTVNDKNRIESLRDMEVDGVITDYPNLFNN